MFKVGDLVKYLYDDTYGIIDRIDNNKYSVRIISLPEDNTTNVPGGYINSSMPTIPTRRLELVNNIEEQLKLKELLMDGIDFYDNKYMPWLKSGKTGTAIPTIPKKLIRTVTRTKNYPSRIVEPLINPLKKPA